MEHDSERAKTKVV
jgi:hypothetical protein